MNKELIEKRKSLIAEFDAIKSKAETEKRSAYSNEERTRVNEIKIELSDIDARLSDEKEIDEKRSAKLDLITASTPAIIKSVGDTEFRSFLNANGAEKFLIPMSEVERRAAITTSTNSQFSFTNMNEGVSIAENELVLQGLGAQVNFFDAGSVDYPSMTSIVASFGTQDNTVADQTLTTAKKTLTPTFVSASLEVSKVFLATSKQKKTLMI